MDNQHPKVGVIVLAIILTAVVVGGGVFFLQQNSIKELREEIQNLQKTAVEQPITDEQVTTSIPSDVKTKPAGMYISSNLGYSLAVPEKWNEYGYTVEYKYTPKSQDDYGVESWEETFYADFPDWPKFKLLTIGSVPKPIYYAEERGYDEAVKSGLEVVPFGSPRYFWGEKLVETNTHVFYSYIIRQDAPQKFIDDGSPMPNMAKDFKVSP